VVAHVEAAACLAFLGGVDGRAGDDAGAHSGERPERDGDAVG
jgi:hypothetical protein